MISCVTIPEGFKRGWAGRKIAIIRNRFNTISDPFRMGNMNRLREAENQKISIALMLLD
jgi:hypothetical protein